MIDELFKDYYKYSDFYDIFISIEIMKEKCAFYLE